MTQLLAIEWLKIKRYRTFWILIGFFLLLLPLWNYQIAEGMIQMGTKDLNILNKTYSFPDVWGNVGFWGSVFIFFLSILVIILTTNEYTFRTNRQNIIDGWNRLQFYHAKVLIVLVLSIVATLYVFITGMVLGFANGGSSTEMFTDTNKLFYFFILSVNYLGFALLVSILVKRSGLSIGLFLLYCLIVENILKSVINWKIDTKIGNLLPLQASDELLPFPLFQMVKQMIPHQTNLADSTYVLVSIGWCIVYYFAGRKVLLDSDW